MTLASLVPPSLRRRRRTIAALAVLLVVRAALPGVVRRVLVSQASHALQARVEIGDVDLALLRGGIALEEVSIRPAHPAAPDDPPLIAWKRFAVAVRWLPLLQHIIRLRAVELEAPRVALERLADGGLNILALGPGGSPQPAATEAPPSPGAPPAAPARWRLGADRMVLRDGVLRFRDLTVVDHEPVELGIGRVEVADASLQPGIYPDPGHLRLEATVEDGHLHLDARVVQRETGIALAATLRAGRLPLRRAVFYVPGVGWSELRGTLDAALKYRLEPQTRDRVYGTLALGGLAVRVPGIEEPALAWRRLAVRLAPLDLRAHRVAVAEVALTGASLLLRPQGGDLLPLLAGTAPSPEAKEPAGSPGKAAAGEPWRWAVASAHVADSRIRLLGGETPLDVGVTLAAKSLAGDGTSVAPVQLGLAVGGGSLHADGLVRVSPLRFAGRIAIADLALPELVAIAGALPPGLLQAGSLGADLTLEAGLAAEDAAPLAAGDLRLRGTLALTKPWLVGPDADEFVVGGNAVTVAIQEVRVPGVLAAAAERGPVVVSLGHVRLDTPVVRLTRTADGLLLPPFTRAPAPASAQTSARPVALAVDTLVVSDGELRLVDRTAKPYYVGELFPLAAETRGIRWPPPAVERLRLTTQTAEKGRLEVTGAFGPAGGSLEVNGRDIPLMPFNPYATTLSGYSVGGGRLSFRTRASYRSGRYTASNDVTLHRFAMRGGAGESLFQQYFGIPLEMALALMRDVHGDIGLEVPLEGDAAGARVDLLTVIGGALRHAIVNALASPLKLAGVIFGGGSGEPLAPAPIPFLPGRAELDGAGEKQLAQLASFLASRPGIAVALDGTCTASDVRWLREQALREELAAGQGLIGTLRTLPQRGTRDTIRRALEARAAGQEGALSGEDAAILDRWLDERPPVAPERLRGLAEERTARVESELRQRYGIEAERLSRARPGEPHPDGAPGVRLTIGTLGS